MYTTECKNHLHDCGCTPAGSVAPDCSVGSRKSTTKLAETYTYTSSGNAAVVAQLLQRALLLINSKAILWTKFRVHTQF